MSWKRLYAIVVVIGLLIAPNVSAQDELVTALEGEVKFELPEGWTLVEEDGYAFVNAPNDEIINVISVEDTDDMGEAIKLLWAKYDPTFDVTSYVQQIDVPDDQPDRRGRG